MKNSSLTLSNPRLLDALLSARLHDPYEYLGPHGVAGGWTVRIFNPYAQECWLRLPEGIARAKQVHPGGLFEWRGEQPPSHPYRIGFKEGAGTRETHDPYAFPPRLSGHDLHLFNEGHLRQAYRTLGAQVEVRDIEAIELLRELNVMVHEEFPGALTIAEESTDWPMVSRPAYVGGLGFSMKWNMGWMNDTLAYFKLDPIYRRYHHNQLTFGQLYAYSENFLLPISHDEVVHGKGSLISKMRGDTWQQFAHVRLLLTSQCAAPGKKLNFMGNELAQEQLGVRWHQGVQDLARDLNHLYRGKTALHDLDFEQSGFEWIDCQNADHSTLCFIRRARNGSVIVVVLNHTPVPRYDYRIGLPQSGSYREIFNSDSHYYCGANTGNAGVIHTQPLPWMGQSHSAAITLPPLAGIFLEPETS